MTARPVLGIIACNRIVGTETAQAVMNRYAHAAMRYADVAALIVPSMPDVMRIEEVLPRLDAILLTGSPSNMQPHRYGDGEGEGPFDPERDQIAVDLIHATMAAQKPLFAMCRGFQEINVALGGTLRRDTATSADLIAHHAPDDVGFDAMFDHVHSVELVRGGILRDAYGTDRLTVNSVHYQGIGRLAESLIVEARAPDGLVEAYSSTAHGAPLIAVQWHPEWQTEQNTESQTYFRLLGKAVRGGL